MEKFRNIALAGVLLLMSQGSASAFNFGFVRVPDWMDSYIGWLLVAVGVSWVGLLFTKPKGVPFNQLPNVRISPIANFFRLVTAASGLLVIVLLFVGMGLRRYAEL